MNRTIASTSALVVTLIAGALPSVADAAEISLTSPADGAVVASSFHDQAGQKVDYYGARVEFHALVPEAAGPVRILVSETATPTATGELDGVLCTGDMDHVSGDEYALGCMLYAHGDTEYWQVATGSGATLRVSAIRRFSVRGGAATPPRTIGYARNDTWDHVTDLATPASALEHGDYGAFRCSRRRASIFNCLFTVGMGDVEYRLTGTVSYITYLGVIYEKRADIKRVFVNYYCLNTGGSNCRKVVTMRYRAVLDRHALTYRASVRLT